MPFEIQHHATMLEDGHRLASYRKAIEELVRPDDCVVDLGTGTGILASYAAKCTSAPVFAIEYFQETAKIAKAIAASSSLNNLRIIQGNALESHLPEQPRVLVTETIGPIGPEENIVEVAVDYHSGGRYLT